MPNDADALGRYFPIVRSPPVVVVVRGGACAGRRVHCRRGNAARNRPGLCQAFRRLDVAHFANGKKRDARQCRVSGYVPPAAPVERQDRRRSPKLAAGSTPAHLLRRRQIRAGCRPVLRLCATIWVRSSRRNADITKCHLRSPRRGCALRAIGGNAIPSVQTAVGSGGSPRCGHRPLREKAIRSRPRTVHIVHDR